ncbi:maltokinase N-terminal cap-like domain-containing protein [Peterkaempfera bronchialis]|uniref:maltokinase N-terminal cap-like domain-containing protein n=1 Tax=Peterkaempfera bronchialis TaxID=2126346 RepID=UPI0013B3ED10|nr:maltokinase [Peterkaempfera bronchialis]
MSDTSRSRRATVNSGPRSGTAARAGTQAGTDALIGAALPLLHSWLPGQRWFAGKGRPVTGITPLAATPLLEGDPALIHLLLRVEQRTGGDDQSTADVYQLLLAARADLPGRLGRAAIGRLSGGPYDGTVVYDAAHDTDLTRWLLTRFAEPGEVGPLAFRRLPGAQIPGGLVGRAVTAEQSNTSLVYGDSLILKLFRRVSPGVNPDLELSLALARAGSTRIPRPAAWFETRLAGSGESDPATLGLLQQFLAGAADGWELALEHVQRLCSEPEWSSGRDGRPADHISGNFSAESFLLGRATAEVHLALGRTLPVGALDRAQTDQLAAGMARRLDAATVAVPDLLPYRPALQDAFRALADPARDERPVRIQRIHGDLHLGQSMRTADGWVLLDFEGEPAKPLAERRRLQPAIRDVAAMLRSFDYAAAHLLAEQPATVPDPRGGGRQSADRDHLARLATAWAVRNRAAYCAGYAAGGGEDPRTDPALMRAFEIDKAVYEVVYEARHRPDWLPIPMSAVRRLAAGTGQV